MKIANIDREFLHIFWTTWANSMKFSGKMCFKILLKVTKKTGLHLLVFKRYIFRKTTRGGGVRGVKICCEAPSDLQVELDKGQSLTSGDWGCLLLRGPKLASWQPNSSISHPHTYPPSLTPSISFTLPQSISTTANRSLPIHITHPHYRVSYKHLSGGGGAPGVRDGGATSG